MGGRERGRREKGRIKESNICLRQCRKLYAEHLLYIAFNPPNNTEGSILLCPERLSNLQKLI